MKRIRVRQAIVAATVIATAITLASCSSSNKSAGSDTGSGSSSGKGGKITIGLLATLTGTTASDGLGAQRGAQLAIKQLNAQGGVAGYTFSLKSEDTKTESNDAVTAGVQDLTSDSSVKAVVAGYASTTNFEINNFARSKTVYLIGGGSAQTEAIIKPNPSNFPTIWSVTPSYDAYGTEPVTLVNQWASDGSYKPRDKSVYIVTSDNPYSQGISKGLTTSFNAAGWKIVGSQTVPFGTVNDWGTVLADIRAKNPDFIVNTDYQVSNEITFLRQFLQNPTKSLMFMQYGPSQPQFIQTAGASGDGVLYNNLAGTIASSTYAPTAALTKAYQDAYGTSAVDPQAVLTYEEVMIYANALKKVGSPDDSTKIGQAIGSSTTVTAAGTVAFDPSTHLAKEGDDFVPIQSFQIQDQKPALLSPTKYASAKFQLPPWMTK